MRRAILAAALVLLAACQPNGPDAASGEAPALESTGIAVTSLDSAGVTETDPAQPPVPADPTPTVVAPSPPEAPKTPQQLACERGGGRYVAAGPSGARACVSVTRDGGKRCSRESDCDGLCLARSQSCAPIKPLFGCNDILQADGRRVTLCVD